MLDFVFQSNKNEDRYNEDFFRHVLEVAVAELGLSDVRLECSLNLVSAERMRELNRAHRGKDQPTDVLSFPLLDPQVVISQKTKTDDILSLGDIFISLDVAQSKAQAANKLKQEVYFLTVHGFLHLLGYDHERSAEEERQMFTLQDLIIARLNSSS